MTKKLQTSQVFIDTEVFVSANFQFNSGRLKRLANFSQKGFISLHLTEITVQEIEANIIKQVQEASKSIKKFQDKVRILKNIVSCKVLFDFNTELITHDLINQFHDFLASTVTNIIPLRDISVSLVFEKYFNHQPPFGEGKKKFEFPDAFSIEALEKWCRDTKQLIYVISSDNDIKTACLPDSSLLSLEKLDELFELITSSDEYLSQLASQFFDELEPEIYNIINYKFENRGFYLEDYYEGEVHSVKVNSINFVDNYLVETLDDVLTFQLTAIIAFSAEVSYPDPDMTYYDKEDGRYIFLETINETVEKTLEIPVLLEIQFSRNEPHNPELISVELETKGDIWISVMDNDVYPYK